MRKIFSSPLIFPLLSAIFPILSLYSANVQGLKISATFIPLVVALLVTGLFLLIGKLLLKDWTKSGFLTFLIVALFFSYGHFLNLMKMTRLPIGRHRFLLPIWGTLFALAIWAILKKGGQWKSAVPYFNLLTAVLVVIPFLWVVFLGQKSVASPLPVSEPIIGGMSPPTNHESPDIYYIILDGYTGSNILLNYYGYDNSPFIDYLSAKGFYVANESHSNYTLTFLSLASSLNMKYLDQLSEQEGADSIDRNIPNEMIEDNRLSRFLRSKGYTIVNLSSGWGPTDFNPFADENYKGGLLNEFEYTLVNTTLLSSVDRSIYAYDFRNRIMYDFEKLGKMPTQEGPMFVFAHLLIPHPPFLFDRDGNLVVPSYFVLPGENVESHRGTYLEQVLFVNKMVETMVDKILSQSDVPPIIILQGDHGSAFTGGWEHVYQILSGGGSDQTTESLISERISIFNAYYLPGSGKSELYPTITPVNSFRLILDTYFGENMGLLEDKTYFSDYNHPYQFFDVTR